MAQAVPAKQGGSGRNTVILSRNRVKGQNLFVTHRHRNPNRRHIQSDSVYLPPKPLDERFLVAVTVAGYRFRNGARPGTINRSISTSRTSHWNAELNLSAATAPSNNRIGSFT